MGRRDVVGEVLRAEPDLAAIEEELHDDPERVIWKVAPGRAAYGAKAIVGAEPGELPEMEEASRRHLEKFVPASRTAVRKLRRDGADARTSKAEQTALEAIVLLMARPAILVQDGRFFPAPKPWTDELEVRRDAIEAILPRVGRIEVTGHPSLGWVGTGWLAAADVVMTNRHVAVEFGRQDGTSWAFSPGMTAQIDYNEELSADRPREFRVMDIIGVHETLDLALLRCVSRGEGGLHGVAPLPIARSPKTRKGTNVFVVGYPASDSRRNDPEQMERVFAGVYKRLSRLS